MTTDPAMPPPTSRLRPMPVFGCLALIAVGGVAGALAVGGSFWAWMAVGALIVVAGIALVIYLARKNTRVPPAGG